MSGDSSSAVPPLRMRFADRSTRRDLLRAFAALTAARAFSPLGSTPLLAESGHVPSGIHFGVQLNAFPIDPHRFQSFLEVLGQIKQVGYQGFESSFRNLQPQFAHPAPARHSIEQTGLTFFGIHIFFPDPGYDQATRIAAPSVYEPVARGGAALGAKYLILSGAPSENRDQLKRKIDALNAAGRYARNAGLGAAYHNHWWEFKSPIGEIEALYSQTDPELVHFVLDAGHAYHGGADVPAFIRAHAKRIVGFHLRDFRNGEYVELGTGTFPLREVAATILQIGWKGWVENEEERADHSQGGLKVIAPAYKAMKEAFTQ
ncbi:MAG TPA: sugar phosphate isomerase/epimerase [Terracidiphilus sp.]|nr:sugar phosphate isomerase/epimerase [Terracidiphilus sp.]